ncbi:hypothetical protein CRG98_039426 [Punica granatum]|nr:hypothetical protein CRG98_039426 [Punica granatum]
MACNNYVCHEHNHRLLLSRTSLLIAVSLVFMSIESAASDYSFKSYSHGKPDKQRMLSTMIGAQGVIYCRSGTKFIPLKGALARISCLAVDTRGYETAPFSILSKPADANGYFLATLSPSEVEDGWRLSECKAFLHSSPVSSCAVPTDANRGISGALLSSYTLINNGKMKLYSTRPFVYSPGSRPISSPSG